MADLIDRLNAAPRRLGAAVAGLSSEEMELVPVPGKWSTRFLVQHVTQASVGWRDLFYQALEGSYPTPRDEDSKWSVPLLEQAGEGVEPALRVFESSNADVARFLATLPESDFKRPFKIVAFLTEPFQINESVNWGLCIHGDFHLGPLHDKRIALGKPLAWMEAYRR